MAATQEVRPVSAEIPREVEADPNREVRRRVDRVAGAIRKGGVDAPALAALLDLARYLVEWREAGGTISLHRAREDSARIPGGGVINPLMGEVLVGLVPATSDVVELERLHTSVRGTHLWSQLSREVQRQLLALVVARLRRLQDEVSLSDPRLEEAFSMLTAWSKATQPGFVIGLSRHHHAVRGSWAEDAEAWWERVSALAPEPLVAPERVAALLDELETTLGRHAGVDDPRRVRAALCGALDGGVSARDPRLLALCLALQPLPEFPELRPLRRALREESEVRAEAAGAVVSVPPDWRWAARVRGRRAVAVGGELDRALRERIITTLDLLELETWPDDPDGRAAAAARVADGTGPLVFAPLPAGSRSTDPLLRACREHRVDWVGVDAADGASRVRRGVERYLDPAMRRP